MNNLKILITKLSTTTRTALENAASIASTFLTTDGIVWRDEEIINSRSEM